MNFERFSAPQNIILIAVIGLAIFLGGFLLARNSSASAARVDKDHARYQFLQVGDTVAAIDMNTGETYAIDGNTRSWTVLAPALPAKDTRVAK